LASVVDQLGAVLAVTPSTASPRFFNQLFAGRDGAALLADALASMLNNSMYTYKAAGVHVLIELELVRRMGALMGFDNPEGVFTPGGSLSNLCGMMLARNEAVEGFNDRGSQGRVLRVYSSSDSHYSIRKAAAVLGVGRDNVVPVAVDSRGRMDPIALDSAIRADIEAGHLPIMINATSGTTVLGAFDPLDALADVADAHGLWLHVDGAYGASMIFHPDFADHFKGIERADSVVWDAHKMMGVPLTCSVILVRNKGLLTKHMSEAATYLFQDDTDLLNPGTRSLQCGRRNDALKLWTAWKRHGDVGYRSRMKTMRSLSLYAREAVVAHPDLELVREPESVNLCFRVSGVDADTLCTELHRRGKLMVGHAFIDKVAVVRPAFVNPDATRSDIDVFFAEVHSVAESMRA
jgi:glutamate/tyrosine decarboxylase-like PLP-dependent enzyme